MTTKTQVLRCAAYCKRIRDHHPHIGVEDYDTGVEFTYHARCQERATEETAARMQRGKVYLLHHYHVCNDENPGYGCSGGCFG
jgi:hypothetical protein